MNKPEAHTHHYDESCFIDCPHYDDTEFPENFDNMLFWHMTGDELDQISVSKKTLRKYVAKFATELEPQTLSLWYKYDKKFTKKEKEEEKDMCESYQELIKSFLN
jgi:hypothetical protein